MDLRDNYHDAGQLGYWQLGAFAGAALSLLVPRFNLLSDTLRDVLDRRLRGSLR